MPFRWSAELYGWPGRWTATGTWSTGRRQEWPSHSTWLRPHHRPWRPSCPRRPGRGCWARAWRGDPWRDLRAAAADRGGWDAGDRRTGSAWRALGKRRRGPSGGSDRRRRPRPRRWRARAAGLAGAGGHPWADDRPLPARPARSRNTVAGAGGTHPRNPAAWRAGADP